MTTGSIGCLLLACTRQKWVAFILVIYGISGLVTERQCVCVCVSCDVWLQLMKFSNLRAYPLLETSMFFIMSYSTFLFAEFAGLTGEGCPLLSPSYFSPIPLFSLLPYSLTPSLLLVLSLSLPLSLPPSSSARRYCGCAILWDNAVILHLHQPIGGIPTQNQRPVWTHQLSRGELRLFLHGPLSLHL